MVTRKPKVAGGRTFGEDDGSYGPALGDVQ